MAEQFLESTGLAIVDNLRELQVFADQCFDDPAERKLYINEAARSSYADDICSLRGQQLSVHAGQLLLTPPDSSPNRCGVVKGAPFVGTLRGFGHFSVPALSLDSLCLSFDDPQFEHKNPEEVAYFRQFFVRAPIRAIVSCELIY